MNRLTPRLLALITRVGLVAFAVPTPTPAAESLSVLLQKAIYAEETEGNLDSAIKLYEQIAAEGAPNRSVIAQAQFRLAVCYQKMGKKDEAVTTLNGLLKDFPADAALGQKSREILAELGQTPIAAPRIRKLFTPDGQPRALSPDCRLVAYNPREKFGSIVIHELGTGRTSAPIPSDKPISNLIFSLNNRQIAYRSDGTTYVAGIDGSQPRAIRNDEITVSLLGWSADPRKIVVLPWNTSPLHIKLLHLGSGELSEVAALPEDMFFDATVSADGRYVTSRALGPGNGSSTISIVDVESGRAATRVEKDLVQVVGWSPGEGRLLFTSLRSGTIDLWAIAMKDGSLAGEPELLRRNVGRGYFEGITSEGSLHYWEDIGASNIQMAAADFQDGRLLQDPRRLTDRFSGVQTKPHWSGDGSSLMIVTETTPRRFVQVSPATGQLREYSLADKFVWTIDNYTWAHTDNALIVQSTTSGSDFGIFRYDLTSETTTPILRDDADGSLRSIQPRISANGRYFDYVQRERPTSIARSAANRNDDAKRRVIRRDLHTGQEKILYELHADPNHWSMVVGVAPDDQHLAIALWRQSEEPTRSWTATLQIANLASGELREIASARARIISMAWTPDSRRVVYIQGGVSERRVRYNNEIWAAPIDGGQAVRLKYAAPNISDIAVHPDGRQFAFRAGALKDSSELWVMEGFLAKRSSVAASEAR